MTHVSKMTKEELIPLAVKHGVAKNVTAARKIGVEELRKLLLQNHADQIDAALAELRPAEVAIAEAIHAGKGERAIDSIDVQHIAEEIDREPEHARSAQRALAASLAPVPHVADISEADEQRDFALREDGAGYVVKREPIPDTAPGLRVLDTQHEEPRRFPHAAKNSGEVYAAKLRRLRRNRRKNKNRISRERHNPVAMQAGW